MRDGGLDEKRTEFVTFRGRLDVRPRPGLVFLVPFSLSPRVLSAVTFLSFEVVSMFGVATISVLTPGVVVKILA